MGLQYHVKKIERKEQIEHCEKFFINQYMWNSKQSPLVYGWMVQIMLKRNASSATAELLFHF